MKIGRKNGKIDKNGTIISISCAKTILTKILPSMLDCIILLTITGTPTVP